MMFRSYLFTFLSFLAWIHPNHVHAGVWENLTSWFTPKEQKRPPTIRVLVGDELENAHVEVQGRYALYDPYTNKKISSRFLGKENDFETLPSGLKWGEEFPGLYQVQIKPLDLQTLIFVNDIEYKGNITIYDTGGLISVVNEVDLEEFLHSTVSYEFDEQLSKEALSAIAITARTNAYFSILYPKNTYWTVSANDVHYNGYSGEKKPEIEEALKATKHIVLSLSNQYEEMITPFPIVWGPIQSLRKSSQIPYREGKISLRQAQDMADRGAHAAQILSKAFPGSSLVLLYAKGET